MAESSTVTILQAKAEEIKTTIAAYERQIEAAKRNLIAVNMTLTLFTYSADTPVSETAPMSMSKMFRRNELPAIVYNALRGQPEGLDTRELSMIALSAKGFDTTNAVLRRAMAMKLVNTLDKLRIKGRMEKAGMRGGVVVWRAPD